MGSLIQYSCPKCKYEVELHEGSGVAAFSKNYICKNCWEISSTLILQNDKNVIKEGINRLRKFILINDDPKQFNCNQCNSNNLEEWTAHHCPKCSSKMQKQDQYFWGFWR